MPQTSIRSVLQAWIAVMALSGMARGHMELNKPLAVYSKTDPQTPEANKDYSMTAPLAKDGGDWPAKKRCTSEILSALTPVATLVSGEDFEWNLAGTAVHNGGSCQVAISYDNCETMAVMASWIGGCPLSLPYTFKVPELPGADKAFFVWEWSNKSGNRELYQNVAVVAVQGTATEYVGPSAFRANTFGDGVCENPETTDVVYPNPGDQVFYGGDYSDASPPKPSFSCAEWDNTKTVTVKNNGGGSGPTGATGGSGDKTSGDAKPTSTDTANSPEETGKSSGSSEATGGSSSGGGEGGGAEATSAGNSGGSTTSAQSQAAASSKASSDSSPSGGSSSANPPATSTSALSDDNSANFIKFGLVVLAVLVLGGVAVCLLRRHSTSHRHYSKAESESDDGTDSESSSSKDSPREEKHAHGHSRGHSHSRSRRHHH